MLETLFITPCYVNPLDFIDDDNNNDDDDDNDDNDDDNNNNDNNNNNNNNNNSSDYPLALNIALADYTKYLQVLGIR